MCNEFFKPTWKKVIGFLVVNCFALIIYLIAYRFKMGSPESWLGTFFTYFYLVLAPFGFLLTLLADALSKIGISLGTPAVITLSVLQNVFDTSWQYAIACFFIGGYCRIVQKKSIIIKLKRRRK